MLQFELDSYIYIHNYAVSNISPGPHVVFFRDFNGIKYLTTENRQIHLFSIKLGVGGQNLNPPPKPLKKKLEHDRMVQNPNF